MEEKNVSVNSEEGDVWYYDQSVSIEFSKSEKTNEEYLRILDYNRSELENCKLDYVKAISENDTYLVRGNLNKIKRILNVNHVIMHKLTHNGIPYFVNKYEFERPNEILNRLAISKNDRVILKQPEASKKDINNVW